MNSIKYLLQGIELTKADVSLGEQANVLVNLFKDDRLVSGNFLAKDSENIEFSRDYSNYHLK